MIRLIDKLRVCSLYDEDKYDKVVEQMNRDFMCVGEVGAGRGGGGVS